MDCQVLLLDFFADAFYPRELPQRLMKIGLLQGRWLRTFLFCCISVICGFIVLKYPEKQIKKYVLTVYNMLNVPINSAFGDIFSKKACISGKSVV